MGARVGLQILPKRVSIRPLSFTSIPAAVSIPDAVKSSEVIAVSLGFFLHASPTSLDSGAVRRFVGELEGTRFLRVAVNGQFLAAVNAGDSVEIWSLATGQHVRRLNVSVRPDKMAFHGSFLVWSTVTAVWLVQAGDAAS